MNSIWDLNCKVKCVKFSVAFRIKRCYSNKRCQQNNVGKTIKVVKKSVDIILARWYI